MTVIAGMIMMIDRTTNGLECKRAANTGNNCTDQRQENDEQKESFHDL